MGESAELVNYTQSLFRILVILDIVFFQCNFSISSNGLKRALGSLLVSMHKFTILVDLRVFKNDLKELPNCPL